MLQTHKNNSQRTKKNDNLKKARTVPRFKNEVSWCHDLGTWIFNSKFLKNQRTSSLKMSYLYSIKKENNKNHKTRKLQKSFLKRCKMNFLDATISAPSILTQNSSETNLFTQNALISLIKNEKNKNHKTQKLWKSFLKTSKMNFLDATISTPSSLTQNSSKTNLFTQNELLILNQKGEEQES